MDETLRKIIEQLSEKTRAGQVNWQMGESSNEYVLFLENATISISMYVNSYDVMFVDCKVSNTRGDIILRENASKESEAGQFLVSFYTVVRDSYTGKENVISSIFSQLKSDKIIGEIPQSDDLPF